MRTDVRVELIALPGRMALTALHRDGEFVLLLDPNSKPEEIREDLADLFGHFFGSGLLIWNGPQEPGLP
ncbi:hypothetical protein [Streptomyces omiyaensis]|uniref:hypothetical protein n=1 Tax=Streptomyces omiyaensis TaxID=68247 RepID=UPI0036FBBA8F